uniref:Uncharacterized protein n=1 Tax=Anguilla anguilla TaxID=7936 RepID=A0A0E9TKE5_ANGAN
MHVTDSATPVWILAGEYRGLWRLIRMVPEYEDDNGFVVCRSSLDNHLEMTGSTRAL